MNVKPVRQMSAKERIMRQTKMAGDCWEWTGQKDKDGYGKITFKGKFERPHRLAFKTFMGEIPNGMMVCHRCDNPPCVNPEHLFLGSALVNRRDAEMKGRQTIKGIKNPKAKLTEKQVAEIRDFLDDHVLNKSQIARNFGVSKSTISRISLGKLWRNRQ